MKLINENKKTIKQVSPAKLFFLAYLVTIFVGGFLLSLPLAAQSGTWTGFMDAIFTATSALCVTGLTTLVTANHWSAFGKLVIIILIQLGGIGIITVGSALGLLLHKRLSLKERMYIAEEKNANTTQGMIKLVKYVILATFIIEGVGSLLLSLQFVPDYGWIKGICFSIFHSISAYCNAGFDLIGENSLMPYQQNPLVILTISGLIVLGGLGFVVYREIIRKRKFKKFSLHAKLAIVSTIVLILGASLIFLALEWSNPETLGPLPLGSKFLAANFQSVTTRTAGFFSVTQAGLKESSLFLTLVLMFIGGSPAGTAGGLKTTTVIALTFGVVMAIKRTKSSKMFGRKISDANVNKAFTLFFISLVWVGLAIFILTISDSQLSLTDIVFEVVSAYGTVGLSLGITPMLSLVGKLVISFTMLFGKLGPITMIYLVAQTDGVSRIQYAEENILVG